MSTLFVIGAGIAIGWQLSTISSKLIWGLAFAFICSASELLFRSYKFKVHMQIAGEKNFRYPVLSSFGMSLILNMLIIAIVGGGLTFAKGVFYKDYWSNDEKVELNHFRQSLDFRLQVTKIINRGTPYSEVTKEDMRDILEVLQKTIKEAEKVSDPVLEKIYPDLKVHYREEFQQSAQLMREGFQNSDPQKIIYGQILIDKWGDWYTKHLSGIRNSVRK